MANEYTVKVRTWGSSGSYFDLSPYIKLEGMQWSVNPIDASGSGRDTQDGKMHRALIGYWRRLDISFIPISRTVITQILQATQAEWLEVQYLDLQTGTTATSKMYRGATLNAVHKIHRNNESLWAGMVIELIEQ